MADQPVQDHRGNVFSSEKEMCKYWNLGVSTYRNRRKNLGWSLEKALETPANFKTKKERPCVDHLGNKFKSFSQMCKHWGLNPCTVLGRLDSGVSLKEALETKPVKRWTRKAVTDPLGKTFPSESAMCKFWGVNPDTFRQRLASGKSLKEALEKPTEHCKPVTDHLGNVFPSERAMCRFWGIHPYTFSCRLKSGMCLKEALEAHVKGTSTTVKDHLGNEFKSFKEMAEHWGMGATTLRARINSGMDLKEALETPVKTTGDEVKDHLGHEFKTVQAMIEYWNLTRSAYVFRKRKGWSLQRILETPLIKGGSKFKGVTLYNGIGERIEVEQALEVVASIVYHGKIRGSHEYLHLLANTRLARGTYIKAAFVSADLVAYYKVPWSKELKTTREIVEHALPELLEQYDKANPKGTYQPMVGTVNPGYRKLERAVLQGKLDLGTLLERFNCTEEQFNTRIKGGASLDEAITGKKDILILREQGQKDKV